MDGTKIVCGPCLQPYHDETIRHIPFWFSISGRVFLVFYNSFHLMNTIFALPVLWSIKNVMDNF